MPAWLRYAMVVLLVSHGWAYLMFAFYAREKLRERGGRWLLGGAVTAERRAPLTLGLHLAAGILTVACGGAVLVAPWIPGAWQPLALGAAAAAAAAFSTLWDGRAASLVAHGAIGVGLSLAFAAAALAWPGTLSP